VSVNLSVDRVRRARRGLLIVIVAQLVAIVGLLALVFSQVHLDDEPYPCTPVEHGVET
jgi:hypothetical protein